MVKKLFALASVTALAGLVSAVGAAGCSETVVEPGASTDAATTTDAKKTDSGKTVTPPDSEDPPPDVVACTTKTDVDISTILYQPAFTKAGACTQADADKIKAYLDAKIAAKDFAFKNSEWATGSGAAANCTACVFSKFDDAKWGVIIADKDDGFETYNRGGCIEIVSKNTECGKAYQQFQNCPLEACSACTTQADFDACRDADTLFSTVCKNAIDNVQTKCGKDVGAYETACKGGLDAYIKTHCITGSVGDAGDGG